MQRTAPAEALVYDVLYRVGEWVPAGAPVVSLLPPGAQQQLDTIVWPYLYALLRQSFPQNFNAQGQPFGLHCPPWPR